MAEILTPQGLEPNEALADANTMEVFQSPSGGVRDNKQTALSTLKIFFQKLAIFTPNNIMESDGTGNPRTTSIATSSVSATIAQSDTNTIELADKINQGVKTTDSPIFADATIAGHPIDAELSTLNNRVNQGVKTTDSPTFSNATIGGHNVDSELDTLNSRVNQGVNISSEPTFANAFIAGHNIDQELDALNGVINQDLNTTASPTFADVILTGLGAIKAIITTLNDRVNQALNTTSTPNFEDINLTGLTGTVENRIEGNTSDIGTNSTDITTLENKTPQSYKTTDAVAFSTVNTGYGANEVVPEDATFDRIITPANATLPNISQKQTGRISYNASGNISIILPAGGTFSYSFTRWTGVSTIFESESSINGGLAISSMSSGNAILVTYTRLT